MKFSELVAKSRESIERIGREPDVPTLLKELKETELIFSKDDANYYGAENSEKRELAAVVIGAILCKLRLHRMWRSS